VFRRALCLILLAAAGLLPVLAVGLPAGAQQAPPDDPPATKGHINVLTVSGLIDSVVADSVDDAVRGAEGDGALALIIQLDSPGAVIERAEMTTLLDRLAATRVPIGVWVGPAGASAEFAAAELLGPVDQRGRAPGATIGSAAKGLVLQAPTLGDFVVSFDGARTRAGTLDTAVVAIVDGQPRRRPIVEVRFVESPLAARLLHITASPAITFLLLLAGVGLLLLELFSLGGGLAAGTAVVCLIPAFFGLAELPTRPLGLGLVGLAAVGAAVDLQAGTARIWTAVSALSLIGSTIVLFGDGLGGPVSIPWPASVLGTTGFLLLVVRALPSVIRSRTTAGATGPGGEPPGSLVQEPSL
jgi:membrane-bound serine protease (ClpP class)